ncbi:hypothetical protein [Bremerella sp.]|uniref:hypothetical protein n=1 Tax=Bremerella sp. TaxID=2795602 RepID=UPI00391A90C8
MTHSMDDNARDFTEFFSRHLIGLCWYEGPVDVNGDFTETPAFRCASGFLLQVEDRFCLVTAGHVLADINDRLRKNGHVAKQHSLFDIWSPRSTVKERIPFDFTDAETPVLEYQPELGIDIAVIELPELYLKMLSQTIEPFTHERWIHQHNVAFDFYAILGIPGEAAVQEIKRNSVTTFPDPQVIFVEAAPLVAADDANTPLPQFFGKILPGDPVGDIAGTSGGPILGFRKNDKGQLHYWPVAVQSRWRARSRTITGTSLPHFALALHEWLASQPEHKAR